MITNMIVIIIVSCYPVPFWFWYARFARSSFISLSTRVRIVVNDEMMEEACVCVVHK